jgi:hypothetical protein
MEAASSRDRSEKLVKPTISVKKDLFALGLNADER